MSPIISDAGGPPLPTFFSFVVGLAAAATLIAVVSVIGGLSTAHPALRWLQRPASSAASAPTPTAPPTPQYYGTPTLNP